MLPENEKKNIGQNSGSEEIVIIFVLCFLGDLFRDYVVGLYVYNVIK